ncbi:hypothetical protein NESM_000460000 [Novymonas esmeraldas]|uniref:Uncharacterized protein n=1 Tax=Novymonas esmeraldas TaxID=1808958 RepID=A0AAW0EQY2_9TRYP
MFHRMNELWKTTKERIAQPVPLASSSAASRPPPPPRHSLPPRPPASPPKSRHPHYSTSTGGSPNARRRVSTDSDATRPSGANGVPHTPSGEFSPFSVLNRPVQEEARVPPHHDTRLPPIHGVSQPAAASTRTGAPVPSSATATSKPTTSPLTPLRKLPPPAPAPPPPPPTSTAPAAPPRVFPAQSSASPKRISNEIQCGDYTVLNRLTHECGELGIDTAPDAPPHSPDYTAGISAAEMTVTPLLPRPPLQQSRQYSMLDGPTNTMRRLSDRASAGAGATSLERRTIGKSAESDVVQGYSGVYNSQADGYFEGSGAVLSASMNDDDEARTDAGAAAVVKAAQAPAAADNTANEVDGLPAPIHVPDVAILGGQSAAIAQQPNRSTSVSGGGGGASSRCDNTSLFTNNSSDFHGEVSTGNYDYTVFNRLPRGGTERASAPVSTPDAANVQTSTLTPAAGKRPGENDLAGRLSTFVRGAVAAATEKTSALRRKTGDDIAGGEGGNAELRRANDLALSQWRYVAMVAKKVAEKKTLVRASRVRQQRVSSVLEAGAWSALPMSRVEDAAALYPVREDSVVFDAKASADSGTDSDVDDNDVSVYDEDGNPLLIPNMSDLWDDCRTSKGSDDGLVAGDADVRDSGMVADQTAQDFEDMFHTTRSSTASSRESSTASAGDANVARPTAPPREDTAPQPTAPPPRTTFHPPSSADWRRGQYDYQNAGIHNGGAHMRYQRQPDPRAQEQMRRHQLMQQQRHQLLLQQQRQQQKHPLPPPPPPRNHEPPTRPTASRTELHCKAKLPWPQPDIHNGPPVYTGQSTFVDFTALTGVRLSDAPRVKSPSWRALRVADEKEKAARSHRR